MYHLHNFLIYIVSHKKCATRYVFITLRNVGRYMPEMFVPLIHCVIDYTLFLATPDFCRMLLQFIPR